MRFQGRVLMVWVTRYLTFRHTPHPTPLEPDASLQTLHFLYHELLPAKSGYTYAMDVENFAAQAAFLAESLRAAEQDSNSEQDSNPDRRVRPVITFDDGHLSDYEYALPVLTRLNLTARFFITAGWTGERAGFMGWPELRTLHNAGQQIGAHGWSHKLLTHCDRTELQRELGDARKRLEDGLGTAITTMSLPGGRSNQRVLAACQDAGYERVFTSEPKAESEAESKAGSETERRGAISRLTGRVNLLATSDVALLATLLAPGSNRLAALRRSYRIKRAASALLGDTLYAKVWALANGQQSPHLETGRETAGGAMPGTS